MKLALLLALGLVGAQVAAPPQTGQTRPGLPVVPPRPTAPGAISGRITDATGKPIAGIEVRTMRRVTLNGVAQLATVFEMAVTGEDGSYRLANRPPGEYYVVAYPYVAERNTPPIGVSVRKTPAAERDAGGRMLGYVLTLFPGVAAEREAATITVETDERTGIDFQMARRPVFTLTAEVEGVVKTARSVIVTVTPSRAAEQMAGVNVRRTVSTPEGRFEVAELPDGEYIVSIRGPGGWAQSTVTIAGAAPSPVVLTLTPDRVVTGRLEFVGKTPPPVIERAVAGPPAFAVELRPPVMTAGTSFSVIPVLPDRTFAARGSGPGPLVLRARAPAPWVQVAGLVDGVDTLDLPFTGATGSSDAVIVLADRPSALLVNVRNEIDRAESDATVILFSDDSRYWGARSRRLQVLSLTSGGTATFNDVPPGKYFVLAGRDFGPNRAIAPAFIESIKARALPIEIAAGESRAVNIRVN